MIEDRLESQLADERVGDESYATAEEEPRVLAVHATAIGQLAGAWYDPERAVVYVLEDTRDTSGWDLAMLFIEQVQPDVILMSSRTHFTLIEKIKEWAAIAPLAQQESDIPDDWNEEGAGLGANRLSLLKLGCWINVEAPSALVSAGIVVAEVKKIKARFQHPQDSFLGLELHSLESMNVEQYMQINMDALT
ncbi:hypothetical protein IAU60_006123 [Kwoniella sp. DSM 27419]